MIAIKIVCLTICSVSLHKWVGPCPPPHLGQHLDSSELQTLLSSSSALYTDHNYGGIMEKLWRCDRGMARRLQCFVNKCNWSADDGDTEDSKKGTQSPASDQIGISSQPCTASTLAQPCCCDGSKIGVSFVSPIY